jgi:hypothetical protein
VIAKILSVFILLLILAAGVFASNIDSLPVGTVFVDIDSIAIYTDSVEISSVDSVSADTVLADVSIIHTDSVGISSVDTALAGAMPADTADIYTNSMGIISVDTASTARVLADTSAIHIDTIGISSTDTISTQYSISDVFFLHPKRTVKSVDALIAPPPADSSLSSDLSRAAEDQSSLSISGYKSFGVSVGELGEVNLEQGLEVTIEGEIRPGTTLGA